ncbi:MAG: DNA polymerase III subunit delta [Dokdonella sp.]
MATSIERLPALLAKPELAPVWLIAGSEHLLVIEAADALRQRARELGYVERDIHDVDQHFDWNELARSGSTLSLFSSRKIIEIRLPTGKPGKEGAAAIIEYCKNPPDDNVLLITCHDWSKSHEGAWSAAVNKVGMHVIAAPIRREALSPWIDARMRSRGLKANRDAIELLAERVEGNLLAAAQEIDKLALLVGNRPLDIATLEDCVADDARYDVFRLTDAAFAGDVGRALHIVDGLRAEGEELFALLGWVLNQLRQVIAAAGGGAGKGGWGGNRQEVFQRALRSAPVAHWERCLDQAGLIDRIVKGRGGIDSAQANSVAWREFSALIAAMAQPRQAASLLVQ